MTPPVQRHDLAPDLSISRVLTGLWQIADMERGAELNAFPPRESASRSCELNRHPAVGAPRSFSAIS